MLSTKARSKLTGVVNNFLFLEIVISVCSLHKQTYRCVEKMDIRTAKREE
jgi:hypothetical protein